MPTSGWQNRVRVGAFYPPVSLEHRAAGWTNPYTPSSSALNTWIGEEFRTVGAEWRLQRLGATSGSDWDLGVVAAIYGWNDPAGVVVAYRGFTLHDRQTPLFGRIGTYAPAGPEQRVRFSEIDGRAGYHAGAFARHLGRTEVRVLHYDNRADPAAFSASIQDYAWDTRFESVGVRSDLDTGWTLMAQWLEGRTYLGTGEHDRWTFETGFALVARELDKHRLAARADYWRMDQTATIFPGSLGRDRGRALTLAWTVSLSGRVELVTEWVEVASNVEWRRRLGEAPFARERSLQLSARIELAASAGR